MMFLPGEDSLAPSDIDKKTRKLDYQGHKQKNLDHTGSPEIETPTKEELLQKTHGQLNPAGIKIINITDFTLKINPDICNVSKIGSTFYIMHNYLIKIHFLTNCEIHCQTNTLNL